VEEDMTELAGTSGGQIAYEVTGLTAVAEEMVAARPELVWDLVADVTRLGGWSPECIRAAWLAEPGRPQPGARFTGHNRFPDGFEYEVTCVVTEAERPRAFAWVVLDDSGDPARPSSSWRYRIDPLPGGGSRVRQRFTHGPGASYLRAAAAKAPDRAAEIIAARRDGLRANMSVTLRSMKAAAEPSCRATPGMVMNGDTNAQTTVNSRCSSWPYRRPRLWSPTSCRSVTRIVSGGGGQGVQVRGCLAGPGVGLHCW
jgi:uncharacterized protein YndB with AHSA1/START domain